MRTTARNLIEDRREALMAERGETLGNGIFLHETADKHQTNFDKKGGGRTNQHYSPTRKGY